MIQYPLTRIFSTARVIADECSDLHTNRLRSARMAGGFGSAQLARRENSPGRASIMATTAVVESEASSLLVILHYLLKNNTKFMMCCGAGPNTSRRLVARIAVAVSRSATASTGGRWGV